MRTPRRKWTPSLRRRSGDGWSNRKAGVLTGAVFVAMAGLMAAVWAGYARSGRNDRLAIPAWDDSWPALPMATVAGALTDALAREVYALAGTHADVLEHIPCYCGCRDQGHKSNMHCYIRRRSPDGRVVEWDGHGRMCPFGPDITGDATLWHQQGMSLARIRAGIEREYSSRGPATPTPPVHSH